MSETPFIPRHGKIVVFDMEFTSWPGFMAAGYKQPGRYPEIIQIGAVKLDASNGLGEIDAFEVLVVPRHNPVLSEYIIDLTGITQATLDAHGLSFADALAAFTAFMGDDTSAMISFGRDDEILLENCALNDIADPATLPKALNVRRHLMSMGEIDGSVQACTLPERMGFELTGREHTGLADARAVGTAIKYYCDQGIL